MESDMDHQFVGDPVSTNTYVRLLNGNRSLPALSISRKPEHRPEARSRSLYTADMMLSDDDIRDQIHQELENAKDLFPILKEADVRIEGIMSESRDIADKCGAYKLFIEGSINLLSLRRDAIRPLNEEGSQWLLNLIKEVVAHLRGKFPAPGDEVQRWPSRIYLQPKDLSNSTKLRKGVLSNNWYDQLHIEVKYLSFKYNRLLLIEHCRLEKLVSQDKTSAEKLESLKFFLENALNLMALRRTDIARVDKKDCRRLVKMIKLFVMCKLITGYSNGGKEHVWPLQHIIAISELLQQMNLKRGSDQVEPASSYSQFAWQGGWLSGSDWHEHAYNELVSTRILYSSQLDEAYNNDYREEHLCEMLYRASSKFLEKSLELLTIPRAKMASLSKEKCYYRLMFIKFFVVLTCDTVSTNQNPYRPQASGFLVLTPWIRPASLKVYHCETASSNSSHHIQPERSLNWRDLVYEELQGLRGMHSYRLDALYRRSCELCKQEPTSKQEQLRSFLENCLNFLATTRVHLNRYFPEECADKLRHFRLFLKYPGDFDSAEQYVEFIKSLYHFPQQRPPYWREEVYAEMHYREKKLRYEVDIAFMKLRKLTHQIPDLAKEWEEARVSFNQVWDFMVMSRSELSDLSKEEYNEKVLLINEDLAKVEKILTNLQVRLGRRIGFPYDISKILLKRVI